MITTDAAGPYLGREEELVRLHDRLADAAAGRGAFMLVRGPAGSGTTATAGTLARRAADEQVEVLWGACAEGVRGRPFGALAEALDEYAARSAGAALYGELGDAAPPLARLAPSLRSVLPAIPPPAPLDAPAEQLRLHDAVVGWISRAAARRPLLIVLDDLQWADADLAGLLVHLRRHLAQLAVLLLGTWADHPTLPPRTTAGIDLLAGAEIVDLPGLDEGATGALLTRVADRPISSAALQLIQQVSGGQPLAALELYRHLREEDSIGRAGGDSLPAAQALPQTVEEIVAWRVARLPPEARSALGALACFPAGAEPALVAPVSGLSRTRAAEALEQAVERGLVRAVERGLLRAAERGLVRAVERGLLRAAEHGLVRAAERGRGYEVTHERVRRAILAGLPGPIREEALGRVADTLEAELGSEARPEAAELAALYGSAAGSEVRAKAGARLCLIAAEQSRAASAFQRAADCFALAVELAADGGHPQLHELRLRLVVAQAEAGRADQTLAAAEQALGRVASRETADALIEAARALRWHGSDEAAEELRLLVERRLRSPDALTTSRLELLAGRWQAASVGDVQALLWVTDEESAERVVLEQGDETDRAELFAPQRARAHEQTVALLKLARDWRRPSSLLHALHGATIDLSTRLGLFREAQSWASQYVAAAERYGAPADHARALLLLARCHALLGDFAAAEETLAGAAELLERLGPAIDLRAERLLAEFALAHFCDGDWPALADCAAELTALPRPEGLLLAAERALAAGRAGDAGTAGALLEPTLELAAQWPPLSYLRDSALLVALTVAWELGWAQHAVRGRALVGLAGGAGVGGNHAATPELASARMYALAGQVAEARERFAAQRTFLDQAGLRPLRAIVDHDEAIAIAAAGQASFGEAAALLERAGASFAELGMRGWWERVAALLDDGLATASQPGGRLQLTYPLGLSRREADLVRLVSSGTTVDEAAARLELEPATAARHLAAALDKLGASDPAELPRLARRHGLGGGV